MDGKFYKLTDSELQCSGQNLTKLPTSSDLNQVDLNQIVYMDLSSNKIASLEGLENYRALETLILDDNYISDAVDFPLCPSLTTLSLNKNLIADLDKLIDKLKVLPSLTYLSLLGNRACPHQLMSLDFDDRDYFRYRCFTIFSLPNLKFLDSTAVSRTEREEALVRGKYLKVVKATNFTDVDIISAETNQDFVKPLPPVKTNFNPHRGIYGACRYRYTGKNSEGNRFIRNNDL